MKPQLTKAIAHAEPAKFYLQALLVSVLVMLAFSAKADLVFPGGMCGHDTNGYETCAVDVASLNGSVDYSWDGTRGHLVYTGTPGNARFRQDQNVGNVYSPSDPYGSGLNVISYGSTVETFTFDFYLDAAGEFVSGPGSSDGSVDVDGFVLGGFSGGPQAATLGGVSLDGILIEGDIFDAGGAVQGGTQLVFDFRYVIDTSVSLLSDVYGVDDSIGQMSLTNVTFADGGNIADGNVFTRNWSGTGATANVFVPVPAAAWLFGSALMALGAIRRRV